MTDDRAREAAEHLKSATLEAIAAGRLLLDLLEEAVQEPGPILAVLVTTLQGTQEAIKGVWDQVDHHEASARPRVQHIKVS